MFKQESSQEKVQNIIAYNQLKQLKGEEDFNFSIYQSTQKSLEEKTKEIMGESKDWARVTLILVRDEKTQVRLYVMGPKDKEFVPIGYLDTLKKEMPFLHKELHGKSAEKLKEYFQRNEDSDTEDEPTPEEKVISLVLRDLQHKSYVEGWTETGLQFTCGMENAFYVLSCNKLFTKEKDFQKNDVIEKYAMRYGRPRNDGWKVHVSVDARDEKNLAKAWDIVTDVLLKYGVHKAKVCQPGIAMDYHDAEKIPFYKCAQRGKQITIYNYYNQFKEESTKIWTEILSEITREFVKHGIQPSYRPPFDKPIKGSHYFSYRNDAHIGEKHKRSVLYNPSGASDPFVAIDLSGIKLQPSYLKAPELSFRIMSRHDWGKVESISDVLQIGYVDKKWCYAGPIFDAEKGEMALVKGAVQSFEENQSFQWLSGMLSQLSAEALTKDVISKHKLRESLLYVFALMPAVQQFLAEPEWEQKAQVVHK